MSTALSEAGLAGCQPAFSIAWLARPMLKLADAIASLVLGVNICVVCFTVICRYLLHEQFPWADEVARALLIALAFFGGATALAHGSTVGIEYFREALSARMLRVADAFVAIVALIVSLALVYHGAELVLDTLDQTTATGLPQNIFDLPMVVAGVFMTVFAVDLLSRSPLAAIAVAAGGLAAAALVWLALDAFLPMLAPPPMVMMGLAFLAALVLGVPIGYVLGFASLVFMTSTGTIPLEAFAQQGAGGTNNFVLLSVPFFMLTGFVMDANGMSVRLVNFLQYAVGQVRGGLNVVIVLSMVIFSGVSGSKLADVAAVGAVLVPAAKKQRQSPADAVALLAASAVMAEAIPPCVNLIIVGYVANVSIGGLFVAGLLPAAFMALALILFVVVRAPSRKHAQPAEEPAAPVNRLQLWASAGATFGMIGIIFGGFRTGFATATEVSAFAVVYAIVVGGLAFREFTVKSFIQLFVRSASRAGMVMFIIGMSQTVAFVLTIEQIPHQLGHLMVLLSSHVGNWVFLLISILLLILMGAMLEGAAALLIFGPLLMPVAVQLGFDPLHYGLLLIIGMGIGFFAPPLGLGMYTSCAIGQVSVEDATRPTLKYLGIMFLCILVLAYVPAISLTLPRMYGY